MRVVCYSGTRNIYDDMYTALKSLLYNTEVDKVYFLIEDNNFPYKLPDLVECRNVSRQTYFPLSSPNYQSKWSYMVLLRAAYPLIFPECDRILSLDVDTIVDRDIGDIWDLDLCGWHMAACLEPECSKGGRWYKRDKYYNNGVALYNLGQMRNDGIPYKLIDNLNTNYYAFPEQDAMNEVCKIKEMSPEYNSSYWTQIVATPKIVHYAAITNYQSDGLVQKYKSMQMPGIQ